MQNSGRPVPKIHPNVIQQFSKAPLHLNSDDNLSLGVTKAKPIFSALTADGQNSSPTCSDNACKQHGPLRNSADLQPTTRTGPILDSGTGNHIFAYLDESFPYRGSLVDANGGRSSLSARGRRGRLTDCYQSAHLPAIDGHQILGLVAQSRLLSDGPWKRIIFEEVRSAPILQLAWGVLPMGTEELIAVLSDKTHGLYVCTNAVGHNTTVSNTAALAAVAGTPTEEPTAPTITAPRAHKSSLDTQDPEEADALIRRLGNPSGTTLRKILNANSITGINRILTPAAIRSYDARSKEARMLAGMTAPPPRKGAGRGLPSGAYLEELYMDTKELRHKGPNGETHVLDIVDYATGTLFTRKHKSFTELPDIIERFVINVVDEARRDGHPDPKIRRIFLDGHPSQKSRFVHIITDLESRMLRHGIALPPIAPGDHRRMARVERAHRTLDSIAATHFHEYGRGLPRDLFVYSYLHAAKVRDHWPQFGYPGNKSSFELRTGRPATVADLPYPDLFATAMIKDLDATGKKAKQGATAIGIVVELLPRSRSVRVWLPRSGKYIVRSAATFNNAFSTFNKSRIADMRQGKQVHSKSDTPSTTSRRTTRAASELAARPSLQAVHADGQIEYFHATRQGVPMDKPYVCPDPECPCYKDPLQGFRSLPGLKRHRSVWKNKRNAAAAAKDAAAEKSRAASAARKLQKALRAAEYAKKPKRRSSRRRHPKHLPSFYSSIRDFADNDASGAQAEYCLLAAQEAADAKSSNKFYSELNSLQAAADAAAIDAKYDSIVFTKDPSPQYECSLPVVTLHSFLAAKHNMPYDDADDALFTAPAVYDLPEAPDLPDEIPGFATHVPGPLDASNRPILTMANAHLYEPRHVGQIASNPFATEIRAAMETELSTLSKYQSWTEQSKVPLGTRLLDLKWVFKIKFIDGKFHKFKARLVGRGFRQKAGVDYDPGRTSAPVARASTFKAVLAEATHRKYLLKEFDVKCAYLLAPLDSDIYIRIPPGVKVDPKTKCLKLCRSLYGLKQSGFNWFRKFSKLLVDIGFTQSKNDPCLFSLVRPNGDLCRIAIWVDDGLCSVSSEELWDEISALITAQTPLSSSGDLNFFLGMKMSYNRDDGILAISQAAKITALLAKFDMSHCNGRTTPIPTNTFLHASDAPANLWEERALADTLGFTDYKEVIHNVRELVGSFGHLACWGRPDICQAAYYIARYQARPSLKVWKFCKHMLRYLKHTKHLSLVYGTRSYDMDSPLVAMVDSDYFSKQQDCTRSTTGYICWLYGCPILYESRKQRASAGSTVESELIAASRCAKTIIYLRRLLMDDFNIALPITPIGEDNQGCIGVARGGGNHSRMRHIRVADSYIFQEVAINKSIAIRYVPSKMNVADMFTKSLTKDLFIPHRDMLMGETHRDPPPTAEEC